MVYHIAIDGKNYRLQLERSSGQWRCCLDGKEFPVNAVLTRDDVLSILIGGKAYEIKRERSATDTHLWVGSARYQAELRDPRSLRSRKAGSDDSAGARKLIAPMPGKIVRVLVEERGPVNAGQGILVIEAMKMQNEIKSPKKGNVQKIIAVEGASVNAGDVLAIVE